MDIYSRCTTTEFKTDISQLCDNCPLKIQIPKAIQEKIIFQAREHYSIDPETILEYLQSEIKKAHNSMNQMVIESKKDGAFLDKVSEIYIWNKERIKALNDFKKSIEQNTISPQKEDSTKQLPKELDTEKSRLILNEAVKHSFCTPDGKGYKWLGDKQLLAYFVERTSLHLKLKKGKLDKEGKQTISWKPFELLFGVDRIQSAKASWMKYNTKFEPPRFEEISKLFE